MYFFNFYLTQILNTGLFISICWTGTFAHIKKKNLSTAYSSASKNSCQINSVDQGGRMDCASKHISTNIGFQPQYDSMML